LLITLLLCHEKVLREPMLYLSLYFKQRRQEYYDLLQKVRTEGAWEEWFAFFVDAVRETARQAVTTANRLSKLVREDRERVRGLGRVSGSVCRVLDALVQRPLISIPAACKATGLVPHTVDRSLQAMIRMGFVKELTGMKRNRLFCYDRYLKVLSEGTEPLP
jgi:Fic family protein